MGGGRWEVGRWGAGGVGLERPLIVSGERSEELSPRGKGKSSVRTTKTLGAVVEQWLMKVFPFVQIEQRRHPTPCSAKSGVI